MNATNSRIKRGCLSRIVALAGLFFLAASCQFYPGGSDGNPNPIPPDDRALDSRLLSGTPGIVIDGYDSDWEGIIPLVTETVGSTRELSVAHDDTFLYFLIAGKRIGPYYALYINSDNNTSTGYNSSPWGEAGFDFLLENGALYRYTGPGWNWEYLGSSGISSNANQRFVELAINRGVVATPSYGITIGFIDLASDWSIKSLLPRHPPAVLYVISTEQIPQMNVIVPAYFYPGPLWDTLAQEAALMPGRLLAIANPASGPGIFEDPNYTHAISNLRNSGGLVAGYVHTSYGARDAGIVASDIGTWFSLYRIDGIFLDEQPNTPGMESYYQSLYDLVKSYDANAIVIGNPGAQTVESYLYYEGRRVSDILCIYETRSDFLSWQPQAWTSSHASEYFAVLPFGVAQSDYRSFVDHAVSRNTGWMFVTDDDLPNQWDTLPPYFADFCAYIRNEY